MKKKIKKKIKKKKPPLSKLKNLGNLAVSVDTNKWTWSIPKDKVGTFPVIVEVVVD